MADFNRVISQLESQHPFQPPSGVTNTDLSDDPELARTILERARLDLEFMNVKPCGFQHERTWINEGNRGEICSDFLRQVSLHCGHSGRLPMKGVAETLKRFEFVSDEQCVAMLDIIRSSRIDAADKAAYLIDQLVISKLNGAKEILPETREEARSFGITVPVEEINESTAPVIAAQIQAKAGRDLRALHRLLIDSIKAAEENCGDLVERRSAFQAVFNPGFEKIFKSHTLAA